MQTSDLRVQIKRRGFVIALLATIVIASLGAPASARVTHHDLALAESKLHSMYGELDRLIEQYDQARVRLQQTEAQLARTRLALAKAQKTASSAQQDLDARARAAYEAGPSWMAGLLDTTSFADLSAGAQDLQVLAQQDQTIAIRAQVAEATARHEATVLRDQLRRRTVLVGNLATRKRQIEADVAKATVLVHQIKASLAKQAAAARAAARQRAREIASASPPPSGGTGGGPLPPPPPPGSGAGVAVAAAQSVLGVPYVWAGASPSGFDCSGLTMWAWGRAGVALPHSAAMQYAMLPKVPQSDLQPGDLVFFYSPIDHVGIYIGGGLMIDANHVGGSVGIRAVYWSVYAGAARP